MEALTKLKNKLKLTRNDKNLQYFKKKVYIQLYSSVLKCFFMINIASRKTVD